MVKRYTSRDRVARERIEHQERSEPHFMTYAPRTRREFMNLLG